MSDEEEFCPHILSEAEIDLYLKGDRREVDRLLLYSINRVSAALMDHMQLEDARESRMERIGGFDSVVVRAKFVDAMILRNEKHVRMMEKVEGSSYLWALIVFLGFVGVAIWEYVKNVLKTGTT
jgi:hypothetical protein